MGLVALIFFRYFNEFSYGLGWNPVTKGFLLSCAEDRTICLWCIHSVRLTLAVSNICRDLEGITKDEGSVQPARIFRAHNGTVEDVAWSHFKSYQFASVGDDKMLHMYASFVIRL